MCRKTAITVNQPKTRKKKYMYRNWWVLGVEYDSGCLVALLKLAAIVYTKKKNTHTFWVF